MGTRQTPEEVTADLARLTERGQQAVVVSYLSGGLTHMEFTDSLVGLLLYDAAHGCHVHRKGGGTISLKSSPRVAEARSQIVDLFLTHEQHRDAQWLLMLDDDMGFDGDLVERLLDYADPVEAPVVGGLCMTGSPDGRQWPTVYRAYMEGDYLAVEPVPEQLLPATGLVKAGATGGACLLVHRWVYGAMLERFRTLADGRPNPYPWFQEGLVSSRGLPLGEDIAFCKKLLYLGVPLHIAMDVELEHYKTSPLTRATCRAWEQAHPDEVEVPELEAQPA